jgi:flagellar basal body-associated protein FliL
MVGTFPDFPQEQKHSHFIVIFSIFVMIVLVFLAYVIYMYKATPESITVQQEIPEIHRRITLTPQESAEKQKILEGSDITQVKLTQKEKDEKLSQIKKTQGI